MFSLLVSMILELIRQTFFHRKHELYRINVYVNLDVPSIIIPPHRSFPSSTFKVLTHFAPNCIDSEGFTIFNVILHAHPAAASMRVRHFRDGEELPWIIYDEFFDYDYEQYRNLDKPVRVLPGDHIIVECDYTSGEEAVLGEMCTAAFFVYTENNAKPKYLASRSWVDVGHQMRVLGIRNYTVMHHGHMKTIIQEPKHIAGELKKVLSHHFDWKPNVLKKFQELYVYGTQYSNCAEDELRANSPAWSSLKKFAVATPVNAILNPYSRPSVCPAHGEAETVGRKMSNPKIWM